MSNNRFKFGKRRPYKQTIVGEWVYEWFFNEHKASECYLRIRAKSGLFSIRIDGSTHAYGYLLAAAEQGLNEQLHGYAVMLYVCANALTLDQEFVDGVNKEICGWIERRERAAAKADEATTAEQEAADQALMEDVAEFADATPKERKELRKQWCEAVRETLSQDKE